MDKPYTHAADQAVGGLALLRERVPDVAKAFGALSVTATATKSLSTKTKELMALAIGIAVHCEGCVATHTRAALKTGATREEVAETVALAVYMGGAPAIVYGGDALRAFDEYTAAATQGDRTATSVP